MIVWAHKGFDREGIFMALANARKIVVGGVTYTWKLRGDFDRYGTGWTYGHLLLTLQAERGKVRQFACHSKHWTAAHQQEWEDPVCLPVTAHKVVFGPGQVRQVIEGTPLTDWGVTETEK